MFTIILFYRCAFCDRPHMAVVDNLPDKTRLSVLLACAMLTKRNDRVVRDLLRPYEIVPPNHRHASVARHVTRFEDESSGGCFAWDKDFAKNNAAIAERVIREDGDDPTQIMPDQFGVRFEPREEGQEAAFFDAEAGMGDRGYRL